MDARSMRLDAVSLAPVAVAHAEDPVTHPDTETAPRGRHAVDHSLACHKPAHNLCCLRITPHDSSHVQGRAACRSLGHVYEPFHVTVSLHKPRHDAELSGAPRVARHRQGLVGHFKTQFSGFPSFSKLRLETAEYCAGFGIELTTYLARPWTAVTRPSTPRSLCLSPPAQR